MLFISQASQTTAFTTYEQLQQALAVSPAVTYTCQPSKDYAITFVSDCVNRLLGYEPNDFTRTSQFWCSRIHPDDLTFVLNALQHAQTETWVLKYRFQHQDGTYRWLQDERKLWQDATQQIHLMVGVWFDITDYKLTELQLQEQTQQQQLITSIALRIRHTLDLEGILNTAAREIQQLLHIDRVLIYQFRDDWSGVAIVEAFNNQISIAGQIIPSYYWSPSELETFCLGKSQSIEEVSRADFSQAWLERLIQHQIRAGLIIPILRGRTLWGLLVVCHYEHRRWQTWEKNLLEQLSIQIGIAIQQSKLYQQAQNESTERKQTEALLHHHALHDLLTGLPNRALFLNRLKLALFKGTQRQNYSAVLLIDVDCFQGVNDSFGHLAGDELLTEIAYRLSSFVKSPEDTVARLSSDEFAILLREVDSIEAVLAVAQQIHQSFLCSFKLNRTEIFVTVSIGISSLVEYARPEDILRDANMAMHQAKLTGRSQTILFNHSMHVKALTKTYLEISLRKALRNQEFLLYYQPIICLKTGALQGFEALVRWEHPERGIVSPADFIALAEETGLIIELDEWVLRTASRQMRDWQAEYPYYPPLTISVNLSTKHFSQLNFAEQIKKICQAIDFPTSCLKLEITESTIMKNTELAASTLQELQSIGIQISMDDFGTGYSSLSYIHRFPIDTLKIDRSFVSNLGKNQENEKIIQAIIMLAHSLGIDVIAEGIETLEQFTHLSKLHCEYGQGFFMAKPLDLEAADIFLAQQLGLSESLG